MHSMVHVVQSNNILNGSARWRSTKNAGLTWMIINTHTGGDLHSLIHENNTLWTVVYIHVAMVSFAALNVTLVRILIQLFVKPNRRLAQCPIYQPCEHCGDNNSFQILFHVHHLSHVKNVGRLQHSQTLVKKSMLVALTLWSSNEQLAVEWPKGRLLQYNTVGKVQTSHVQSMTLCPIWNAMYMVRST